MPLATLRLVLFPALILPGWLGHDAKGGSRSYVEVPISGKEDLGGSVASLDAPGSDRRQIALGQLAVKEIKH